MLLLDWMERRSGPEAIEIDEVDADIVGLFFALGTQWRHHPMTGTLLGLDYASIRPTADLMGIGLTPAVFGDLRDMEAGAIEEMVKTQKGRGK